jgi:hypothetical protein
MSTFFFAGFFVSVLTLFGYAAIAYLFLQDHSPGK